MFFSLEVCGWGKLGCTDTHDEARTVAMQDQVISSRVRGQRSGASELLGKSEVAFKLVKFNNELTGVALPEL